MFLKKILFFLPFLFIVSSCSRMDEQKVKEMIKNDPSIVIEMIKAHPVEFMTAVQEAAQKASQESAKQQQEVQQKRITDAMNNPLKPTIRPDENIRGQKEAPLQLVIYSDFECPYCSRAYTVVKSLIDKYGDKIQYIYKHLPLPFHQYAYLSAAYYEGIRLQSGQKAWQFHDEILQNQGSLKNGEKYLKEVAQKLGVDMKKLSQDIQSDTVKKRISEDESEAKKWGFEGTPGFLLNGIPIPGALPLSHFESIINELKDRKKITL